MPKGIYIRTKENCKNISLSRKNNPRPRCELCNYFIGRKNHVCKPVWNKGIKQWEGKIHPRLGKSHTEEARLKISKTHKGKIISGETRKKLSLIHKGKPKSNKFKEMISKVSKANWNNLSIRDKIVSGLKESWSNNKIRRNELKERRLKQIFPFKDTLPEKLMQNKLKLVNINFRKHEPIIGQPDIFIEPDICIFIDGCYWHGCEKCYDRNKFNEMQHKAIIRSILVTRKLIEQNYIVLRLWEHEIKDNIEECMDKIVFILKDRKISIGGI